LAPAKASIFSAMIGLIPWKPRIRGFIEELLEAEVDAAVGRDRYERAPSGGGDSATRIVGTRHGHRQRGLMGTFGATTVRVPRARLATGEGKTAEWRNATIPAYQRRTRASNANADDYEEPLIRLSIPASLKRTGKEMKFIVDGVANSAAGYHLDPTARARSEDRQANVRVELSPTTQDLVTRQVYKQRRSAALAERRAPCGVDRRSRADVSPHVRTPNCLDSAHRHNRGTPYH
jgi:Transposase, Mutator family